MGRPKKSEHENRSDVVRFRVTPAEKVHAEKQAALAGLSLADYARQLIIGHRVRASAVGLDAALLVELNQIGLSLAEFARHPQGCDPTSVESILSALQVQLDAIGGTYGA